MGELVLRWRRLRAKALLDALLAASSIVPLPPAAPAAWPARAHRVGYCFLDETGDGPAYAMTDDGWGGRCLAFHLPTLLGTPTHAASGQRYMLMLGSKQERLLGDELWRLALYMCPQHIYSKGTARASI